MPYLGLRLEAPALYKSPMAIRHVFALLVFVPLCASAWSEERTVPFDVVRGRILVPALLNGEKVNPFLLDLCVQSPVCDRATAQQYGLLAPDAAAEARIGRAELFQVGNAPARDCGFVIMDLSGFTHSLATPVLGIFSGREIADEIVLDFEQNSLVLRKGRAAELESDQQPDTVRILDGPAETLMVSAVLGGRHVRPVLLDTAFAGTLAVPERVLREAGLIGSATRRIDVIRQEDAQPSDAIPSQMSSGETQVRLSGVRIGAAEIQSPVCTLLKDGQTPRVGLGFLRHFTVTINYASRLVRLENLSPGLPQDPDIAGIGLVPGSFDGRCWSVWVVSGSSAVEAGIKPGCRLISVNEREAEGLDFAQVLALLDTTEGETVSVVLERADGSTKTHVLKSTPLL